MRIVSDKNITRQKKIFFILGAYPPAYSGAGKFIQRLANGFVEHRYQCCILTKHNSRRLIVKKCDGKIDIYLISNRYRNLVASLLRSFLTALLLCYKSKSGDVLFLTSVSRESILPILMSKVFGLKVVVRQTLGDNPYLPGDDCVAISKRRFGNVLLFLMRNYVDHIVAISPALMKNNIGFSIPAKKLSMIPNFPPVFNVPSDEKPYQQRDMNIVFVGVVCKRKGVDTLIEAWKIVHKKNRKVKLQIVGPNSKPPEEIDLNLVTAIQNLINDGFQIEMVGRVNSIEFYLLNSIALVLPSRMEGFPNVVVEAMALKTPVIMNEIQGITDYIMNESSGYIVPQDDVKGLADAMLNMINKPKEAAEMGKNARARYEVLFSEMPVLNKYLQLINSI